AHALSRKAQRAGLCREHGAHACRDDRRRRGGDRGDHHRERLSAVLAHASPGRPLTLLATILGCGSSGGVPRVGYRWGARVPQERRNRRRRCSLLVERHGPEGTTTVLVDTGPDLRMQLLDAGVQWVDGVLYTHEHADHTHGIDDLRVLAIFKRRLVDV